MQIAIDGPSGSGKSTIAKRIASTLGYLYLDTGAMYRAVALFGIRSGVLPDATDDDIVKLARCANISFSQGHTFLNGEDVTAEIRSEEVTKLVYLVAQNARVRALLVEKQREIAGSRSVVMDGRDIGTVVLPDADVKVFLTASAEERARRRHTEIMADPAKHGYETAPSYAAILEDVNRRDHVDSIRSASPLRAADDAVHIDSTSMTLDEVIAFVIKLVEDAHVSMAL